MDVVFHTADGKRQQIMIFADGRRICPQARQKVAGKCLLAILGAEDEVDMVLCVAVGHVSSLGAAMLQHGKACRHLRGSYAISANFSQGFRTWARLVRPAGAGMQGELQRNAPNRVVTGEGDHWSAPIKQV